MLSIRTILHPTDFSERAGHAFAAAYALAQDHGARLIVLHVAPPPTPGAGSDDDYRQARENNLRWLRVPESTVAVEPPFRV